MTKSTEASTKKRTGSSKARTTAVTSNATLGSQPESSAKQSPASGYPSPLNTGSNPLSPSVMKAAVKPSAQTVNEAKLSDQPHQPETTKPPTSRKAVATPPATPKKATAKTPKATKAQETPEPAMSLSLSETKATGRVASAGSAQLPNQAIIDQMVEEAAYYLAEKRNFASGFEEQDWLAAKKQIMEQLQGAKNPLE